ncbi:hypothetical protein ACFWVC_10935 [Streptomyces sp. NPDC058691]|uniref:hypothetical protein n=1 Tax=Streptomyces sp. NPDC058691 TaxID=3346601 RepID=UPI0036481B03
MGKNDPTRSKAGQQRQQDRPQERIGQTRDKSQGMTDEQMRQQGEQGRTQQRQPGQGGQSGKQSSPSSPKGTGREQSGTRDERQHRDH